MPAIIPASRRTVEGADRSRDRAAAGALVALAVQGAGMGVQAGWAILPVAVAGYLVGGLGHGVKNVLLRALITARVPDAVLGRAFAAYTPPRNTAELSAPARRHETSRRQTSADRAAWIRRSRGSRSPATSPADITGGFPPSPPAWPEAP